MRANLLIIIIAAAVGLFLGDMVSGHLITSLKHTTQTAAHK